VTESLSWAETFALRWVILCEKYGLDPKTATALDFERNRFA
jgi:hypothetical protein